MNISSCTKKQNNIIDSSFVSVNTNFDYRDLMQYLEANDSLNYNNYKYVDTIKFESYGDLYFNANTVNFVTLPDSSFVISNSTPDPFLLKYSKDGSFLMKISRDGKAFGEYNDGGFLEARNNIIFMFDRINLKIIEFSFNGDVLEEKIGPTIGIRSFKVTSNKDLLFYYVSPSMNAPLFSILTKENSLMRNYGKMEEINLVSEFFPINGIAINENNYIFVIQPLVYGISLFSPGGKFVKNYNQKTPDYFVQLKKDALNKVNKRNIDKLTKLYWNHSRQRDIFYLGQNVLMIQVENPIPGKELSLEDFQLGTIEYIPTYLEFWLTDGKYLGSLFTKRTIAKAEYGKLYYWHQPVEKNQDGFYPNPNLVSYDLWQKIGQREN